MPERQHSYDSRCGGASSGIAEIPSSSARVARPAASGGGSGSGGSCIAVEGLRQHIEMWVIDAEISRCTARTVDIYRTVSAKLLWFLTERQQPPVEMCGPLEIRRFLLYLERGHEENGGRWQNGTGDDVYAQPLAARTVFFYYSTLRTLFRYLIAQDALAHSPFETIPVPKLPKHQVQPFTMDQVRELLTVAGKTACPQRDRLILYLLLDTGIRVTELSNLSVGDVDLTARRISVLGKGEKRRMLYYGRDTSRALHLYLRKSDAPKTEQDYLITAARGRTAGEPVTRNGIFQLIDRLGDAAGLSGSVRCSPHTFRHTFAIEFLRNGGNVFALKELLGHTSLSIVNRYVALAAADLERQHRQFSPVDRLQRKAQKP